MGTFWGTLVVAIIGAAVSITAAGLAWQQAKKAQESAEKLDSRAHKIARIDAQIEELRAGYKYLLETYATGDLKLTAVAAEFLGSSQGATEELREKCRSKSQSWAAGDAQPLKQHMAHLSHQMLGLSLLHGIGDEYRATQKELADDRDSLTTNKG